MSEIEKKDAEACVAEIAEASAEAAEAPVEEKKAKKFDLNEKDERGETLKRKIMDWCIFAVICLIVVVFGVNKLFNRMGTVSLLILFGIVVVLSFFMMHIIVETGDGD